jgi:SPRY domain
MITGIIAQESRVPRKGTVPLRLLVDDDVIPTALLVSDTDKVLRAGLVTDPDAVFAGVAPRVLSPALYSGVQDLTERVFLPRVSRDQVVAPLFLYTSADVIPAADVRFPGLLVPQVVVADDETVFAPLLDAPGSFSAPLHVDADGVILPRIAALPTLFAALVTDLETFHAPQARIGIRPPFFLSDDLIPNLATSSRYFPGLVFDDARPVTPVATFDGAANGATITNFGLTVTQNQPGFYFGGRSAMLFSTGKHYFEVTVGPINGDWSGVGIARPETTYQQMTGHLYSTTVTRDFGVIWSNNDVAGYQLGTLQEGDVIGVAVDLGNHLAWFRRNGGPWQGTLPGGPPIVPPADPVAGLRGVTVEFGEYAPAVFFGSTGASNFPQEGDFFVGNFGGQHYSAPLPAGFDHWQIPSPFPVSQTADRFGDPSIVVPTKFTITNQASLSGDGLTATHSSTISAQARSASAENYGRWYFEVTVNATHGWSDSIGIMQDQGLLLGDSYVLTFSNGQIWSNSGTSGRALGRNLVAGDVVGIAVDLTGQTVIDGGRIWFTLNGGPWNGVPESVLSQDFAVRDPLDRDSGLSLSGFNYGTRWVPSVWFGGTSSQVGDGFTANFGGPFALARPPGFGPWPTELLEVVHALKPILPTDADSFPAPSVDTSIRVVAPLEVVSAGEAIPTASAFGGNLSVSPNAVVADADAIFAPGYLGSFGGLASSNVTVSNSDLTATLTTSVNNTGARSANFKGSGKYYFEITAGAVHSSNGAGLLSATGTYFNMINNGTNCVQVFASSGNIWSNNNNTTKTLGALAAGNVLGFAVDLTARKAWVRKGGGNWNGDATADPVSGAGGVTVGTGFFAPAVGFGGGGQVAGDSWTGNFGQAAFASPVPTGFNGGWPGGTDVFVLAAGFPVASDDAFPSPSIANFTQGLTTGAALASDDALPAPKLTNGATATLDGTATNVTLSGGNLVATHNTATTDSGARSATTKSAGRFYFEAVVGQSTGANDLVGMTYGTYPNMLNATPTNAFGVRLSTGVVYGSNINSGFTVGTVVAGDVLGFAVDFGLGRGWVRKNGGAWNGAAGGDPVANVSGAVFATGQLYAPAVAFGGAATAINDAVTFRFGPAGVASLAGFGDWTVLAPSGLASFDGAVSAVNVSNDNLTATHASAANNAGVRSLSLKSTGKFYFEVAMTTTHGAFDCAGILTSSGLFVDLVANGANCVVAYKNTGNIFSNNANSGKTLGAMAAGDVLGFAIDLTARKGWVRKNGGNWNGLAIGSENPATGLGGVTIAATATFAPAVGFGGTGTAAGDEMTANFGGTSFAATAPAGFTNWTV